MTHPADNTALLTAVADIRAWEHAQGAASRQPEVDALTAHVAALQAELATLGGTPRQRAVGVRVFPHYRGTAYADHDRMLATLLDVGVRRISADWQPDIVASDAVIDFYRRAVAHGIRLWLCIGKPRVALTGPQWDTLVQATQSLGQAGAVEMVSGWNEPNHYRNSGHAPAGWETAAAKHQRGVWEHFGPLGIQVATGPLWSGNLKTRATDEALLAPLVAPYADVANLHQYPRIGVDDANNTAAVALARRLYGDRPIYVSEGGYSTRGTDGNPVTEDQQAALVPAWLDWWVTRGHRASLFELCDGPAASREDSLGIVRPDWTYKPAAYALKEYLAA